MSKMDFPVEKFGEVMDLMSDKLPKLFKDVYDALFSEESAKNVSKGVGTFYKNLLEAGMDKEAAMQLTLEYLGTFKSLAGQFRGS